MAMEFRIGFGFGFGCGRGFGFGLGDPTSCPSSSKNQRIPITPPEFSAPPALPPIIYLFHYFPSTSHFGHLSRPHLAHAPPPPHCARGARCNPPLSSPAMPSSLLVPILVGGMLFTVRSVHICAFTLY